jgi:hypothetical protein
MLVFVFRRGWNRKVQVTAEDFFAFQFGADRVNSLVGAAFRAGGRLLPRPGSDPRAGAVQGR